MVIKVTDKHIITNNFDPVYINTNITEQFIVESLNKYNIFYVFCVRGLCFYSGKIVELFRNNPDNNSLTSFEVHYQGWNDSYNELIVFPSPRIQLENLFLVVIDSDNDEEEVDSADESEGEDNIDNLFDNIDGLPEDRIWFFLL